MQGEHNGNGDTSKLLSKPRELRNPMDKFPQQVRGTGNHSGVS